MDGNLAMLNYQQYGSETEFNEAYCEHHEHQEKMKLINLLLEIIKNNPGITVVCPDTPEMVREVFRNTGVLIRSKNVIDSYDIDQFDRHGNPVTYERNRINRREYHLSL